MRLTFVDHQGKGMRLAGALAAAGHDLSGGDTLLIDADIPVEPYASLCNTHERVVLYPHGGGLCGGDGQWPVHPHTAVRFVIGTGQADVLALCGYPVPVEVIGWPFSDVLPPRHTRPQRVLLAPEHPMIDGWLSPGAVESNRRIHDRLAALGVELTVRYVDLGFGLEHQGIVPQPHVTYQSAGMFVGHAAVAVQGADVVVAAQGTFPSLALALGTPTVMYGQHRPDDHENESDEPHIATSWESYRDEVRYPLDADTYDVVDLVVEACRWPANVLRWLDRFVGRFDDLRFVRLFEKYA